MRPILFVIAAALSILLYRMLSRGGKTYAYSRTQTLTFMPDGSENAEQHAEAGSIIITNKTVLVDGLEYTYKPMEDEPLQAVLEYDENGLRCVRVILPEGEKQYFIEKAPAAKGIV